MTGPAVVWPFVLGGALLLLALILLAPIKLCVEYSDTGFTLRLKYLPFRFLLYPPKPAKKKKKKPPRPVKAPKEKKESGLEQQLKDAIPGDFASLKRMLPDVLALLKKIGGYFRCDRLVVDYVAASDDAFATAMQFGGAYTAALFVYDILAPALKCKRREISVNADFLAAKPRIYLLADISSAPWQIFAIVFIVLKFYFKNLSGGRKSGNEAA